MKRNIFLRVAALLVVSCMFSLCTVLAVVPGSLSKYSRIGTGGTGVRAGIFMVALKKGDSWVNIATGEYTPGKDGAKTFEVNLFDTLLEGNVKNDVDESVGEVGKDTDFHVVKAPDSETAIIAPGTGGEMKITVKNFSEVGVEIDLKVSDDLDPANADIAIEWWDKTANSGAGDWVDTFPGLATDEAELAPIKGTEEYEIQWRWRFERTGANDDTSNNIYHGDYEDTEQGIIGQNNKHKYTIAFDITATQID